jgi:glutamate dehydrogenase
MMSSSDAGGHHDEAEASGPTFWPNDRRVSPEQIRDDLVDRAAHNAPDLADLIQLYYRYIPPEDVLGEQPGDLVGAVRSHRALAERRVPGRPAVRVQNPSAVDDGWSAQGTVVQIVTDDMPYLVESVAGELVRSGARVQRVVHPIVVVRRDVAGGLREVLPGANPADPPADAIAESWMSIEVDLVTDPDRVRDIEIGQHAVLTDVREVVEDTDKMATQALSLADTLDSNPPPQPREQIEDGVALLRWLAKNHFTFLGYRYYELVATPGDDIKADHALRAAPASGLGVLRQDSLAARSLTAGPDATSRALSKNLLVLTEASAPSTVYRSVYPYYVGIKTFDEDGNVTGEHRFLGVFTTNALHAEVLDIPVVERRVRDVIHRAGFPLQSYSGQRMLDVIQNWPRTELFSTDTETLYGTVTGVLALADRRRLRLFLRTDAYGRFFSCLVFLPRDRYTTIARLAMQEVLLDELGGTSLEYSTRVGETALAQIHFTVHTDPSRRVEPDVPRIQERLIEAVRGWDDRMVDAVIAERSDPGTAIAATGSESAVELGQRFAAVFPESYKEDFTAADALADLRRMQGLRQVGDIDMSFYVPQDAAPGERRFRIYFVGRQLMLTDLLPILVSLGAAVVDQRPYELRHDGEGQWWIYDFGLRFDPDVLERSTKDLAGALRSRIQDAFVAIWRHEADADYLNLLIVKANLTCSQVCLLRMYLNYIRQISPLRSYTYSCEIILRQAAIAALLVEFFAAKFDPDRTTRERRDLEETLALEIEQRLNGLSSEDDRHVFNYIFRLIGTTVRTNYYVRDDDGSGRSYLAVKLEPQEIPELPEPRPRFEIFVYSPRVEGVHLRFGAVARGGLRWSDRREDFRTEILGLVKAQAVKNAVIVPVGAKGGFVVKRPPVPSGDASLDREAFLSEGIACYRMFISGLLDLTDNRIDGIVKRSSRVVRYDEDDTYLVVAADKGTATFSDIANDVAKSYGFWLGDAFASGGSVGYDHKAMGITARGAWESVKRHFRELGLDTQAEEFTVVGVGDMSGDVFGNGMLLSEHIRLVAAFDHRHVFIDPDPTAAPSYAERRRLFDLPRSSWDDYDRSLISEGGGVWPRTAKAIPVSEQAARALGIPGGPCKLAPADLMKAILLAPVDLLWNGGIGTYVKASTESHAEVGDKANDALRVDGNALRVKVVGEGGNLGLTQRGRIEFAKAGGKVNTDALDNSAGVDCSDHEVNIKILLDHLVTEGKLAEAQRNELLAEMTDEVGRACLERSRLIGTMIDAEEKAPSNSQLSGTTINDDGYRRTSPELTADVLAEILRVKRQLLAGELVGTDVCARYLLAYFPRPLAEAYEPTIREHPLRKEIVASELAIDMVLCGGEKFWRTIEMEVTADVDSIAMAYAIAAELYLPLGGLISLLPPETGPHALARLQYDQQVMVVRVVQWIFENMPMPLSAANAIRDFGRDLPELVQLAPSLLQGAHREDAARAEDVYRASGMFGVDLASLASLQVMPMLLDAITIADSCRSATGQRPTVRACELLFELFYALGVDHIFEIIQAARVDDHWDRRSLLAIRREYMTKLSSIVHQLMTQSENGLPPTKLIERWLADRQGALQTYQSMVAESLHQKTSVFSRLFVALQALTNL